jgi:hypothetical protein
LSVLYNNIRIYHLHILSYHFPFLIPSVPLMAG